MLTCSKNVASQRESAEPIKCLIWDLDETIWQGRILDGETPRLRDGITGILNELDSRGILLSIASANDYEQAVKCLEYFSLDVFFLVPEINFSSKPDAILRIASRLNVDPRYIGFIDDDSFEQELVSRSIPAVRVYDASEIDQLTTMPCFQPQVISKDSKRRREFIRYELARQDAESNASNLEKFLHGCDVSFNFRTANMSDLDRILELILRTNQMNASANLHSADEVVALIESSSNHVLIASMSDRFGEYGSVAVALASELHETLRVDGLWMSCRVAKRGLPQCVFTSLADLSEDLGLKSLDVVYRSTEVNRLALFHLSQYGFTFVEECCNSNQRLMRISIPDGKRPYPTWIKANRW